MAEIGPQLAIRGLGSAAHWVDDVAGWLHAEWFAASGESLDQVRTRLLAQREDGRPPLSDVACLKTPDGADGPPVGLYTLEEMANPVIGLNLLCLSNLYVVPFWRGRDIGQRLCNAALDRARGLGAPRLSLFTASHMAFYQAQGWRGIKVATCCTGGEEAMAVAMQREVEPNCCAAGTDWMVDQDVRRPPSRRRLGVKRLDDGNSRHQTQRLMLSGTAATLTPGSL